MIAFFAAHCSAAGTGNQESVRILTAGSLVRQLCFRLRIKPEVSTIASQTNFGIQGFNLPAFTVRRADTTVEMASGQTFAIAGLFQSEITRNVSKVPLLGDLPILRELFRSKRYQRNETELVILITPYLVRPVSDKSLTTPLEAANTSLLETTDFIGMKGGSLQNAPRK